jgi:hypothetical protein
MQNSRVIFTGHLHGVFPDTYLPKIDNNGNGDITSAWITSPHPRDTCITDRSEVGYFQSASSLLHFYRLAPPCATRRNQIRSISSDIHCSSLSDRIATSNLCCHEHYVITHCENQARRQHGCARHEYTRISSPGLSCLVFIFSDQMQQFLWLPSGRCTSVRRSLLRLLTRYWCLLCHAIPCH